jgi:hypothetical protein
MNYKQAFPSTFLKADDLAETGSVVYTIRDAQVEDVGQDENKERKLCLYFEETDQKMVLNRTNADACALMFGEYTEQWVGQKVQVYVDHNVRFGNKVMSGLRITDPYATVPQPRAPMPQHGAVSAPQPRSNHQAAPQPQQPSYPPPTPQQMAARASLNAGPHYPPQPQAQLQPQAQPLPRQAHQQARQQYAAQHAQEYDGTQNYAPAPAYPYDESDPFGDA